MAVGIRCADHATASTRKTLALTSPTSGGGSVSIVRLGTAATEFSSVQFSSVQFSSVQFSNLYYNMNLTVNLFLGRKNIKPSENLFERFTNWYTNKHTDMTKPTATGIEISAVDTDGRGSCSVASRINFSLVQIFSLSMSHTNRPGD
jgi:hypothetical protein